MQYSLSLDFVMSFCRDKIPGFGEDSYCYSFCDGAGLLGVFDGCGGIGAKTHNYYSGHTEAYMASRLCAGAFYDQFRRYFPCDQNVNSLVEEIFASQVTQRLRTYCPPKDAMGFQIKGASVRTLPSTAAVALIRQDLDGAMLVTSMWAGDSRVYIMNALGLAQLTVDDTTVTDPMMNIYEDGILNNVLCCDKPVCLHYKTVKLTEPFVVFSATDGCFGYLSTPMEFEGVLLDTLMKAQSAAEWESRLADAISSIAGDDHTICLATYGYGRFKALQEHYAKRHELITKNYVLPISNIPIENREIRFELWNTYRDNYMRCIKDGFI